MKPQHGMSTHNHRKYKAAIVILSVFLLLALAYIVYTYYHDERPFASEYDLRQRFVVSH